MYHALLDLPVPVTSRPLRFLGGGSSSSKGGPSKHHLPRRTQGRRFLEDTSKCNANQTKFPSPVPNTAIPLPTESPENMTATAPAIPPMQQLPRQTITIFTELNEDAASADDLVLSSALGLAKDCSATEGASRSVYQDPLASTQTLLSPLSYSFLCQQTDTDDPARMAATFSSDGAHRSAVFGGARPEGDMYKFSLNALSHADSADVVGPNDSSFPSVVQNEASFTHAWAAASAGSADTVQHPLRFSAIPVVPIVPHVTEPSSRKRVAEDMQQFYGSAAATVGTALMDTANEIKQSPASAAEKNVPFSMPKKKNNKIFFFGSPSSPGTKKNTKAEEKRTPPQTATERRLAREQIIRVGVQRLYRRLNELRLSVYRVRNDGNCQFRAISHQLLGSEDYHDVVRSQIVSYMRSARSETFDHYFESAAQADVYYDNLAKLGSWGDELSLRAASDCLCVNIHVLSSEEHNCYITYRPSPEHCASAPLFLVDMCQLRERRRAERRLLRERELHNPSQSHHSQSSLNVFDGLRQASSFADRPEGSRGVGAAATMPSDFGYPLRSSGTKPVRGECCGAAGMGRTCTVPRGGAHGLPGVGQSRLLRPVRACDIDRPSEEGNVSDDDGELDANAIQLALHRRLQHSEIYCSGPRSGKGSSSFGALASWGGLGSGEVSTRPATMPLLQPQSTAGLPSGTQHIAAVASPAPRLVGGNGDASRGGCAHHLDKFCAVGAAVQPLDTATQPINVFTQKVESPSTFAMNDEVSCHHMKAGGASATAPPSAVVMARSRPLLRPQSQDGAAVMSNDAMEEAPPMCGLHGSDSFAFAPTLTPTPFQGDEAGEVISFAASRRRNRPKALVSHSFPYVQSLNSFTGLADSFNADISQSSSNALLAFGGGQRETNAHSPGSFVPRVAVSSFASGADDATHLLDSSDAGSDMHQRCCTRYFIFEPRTEPIDIFLSYLYPVHYNSISAK